MTLKPVLIFLAISFLVFVMAGGVSLVAAAESDFFPGGGTDPGFFSPEWKPKLYTTPYSDVDFLSPSWEPAKYTTPYSDVDFLSPSWEPAKYTTPYSDVDFLSASWEPAKYTTPYSDAGFLNKNWSVHTPVAWRYNLIDSSVTDNLHLDPFASVSELRSQGWDFKGNLVFW